MKNRLKKQKKKKMEYKQYTFERLQNMFGKEHNLEELNKIMGALSDKYDILSDDNEVTNNILLDEKYISR